MKSKIIREYNTFNLIAIYNDNGKYLYTTTESILPGNEKIYSELYLRNLRNKERRETNNKLNEN